MGMINQNDGGLPVHLNSFHRRKEVISLHKTRFANEEIPDPAICKNGEILRINVFRGKKTRPHISNWFFWF